jgi:mono/diheme cytochrome c family protein
MRLIFKILLGLLVLIVLALAGMLSYVKLALPRVSEAPDLTIEHTPERLERGEYLAWYVSGCIECHSQRDLTTFSAPVVPGTEGSGGIEYTREMGMPGSVYPPNITPVGLGEWTDGEIFRAITAGVDRDGKALFPLMPYNEYRVMDKEDIYSIIAYIRTLEPKGKQTPETKLDFPMNLIVNVIPKDPEFTTIPDTSDWIAYGKYMANAGGCISCHSKQDERGVKIPGMHLAGGNEYFLPGYGIVRSANLTPDPETGIGRWTEEAWLARMKAYANPEVQLPKVLEGDFNSIMSWELHSRMSESDLRAIYRYIQSAEPVSNKVERFTSLKDLPVAQK